MKRLLVLTACLTLTGAGWALAQNKPAPLPTPAHSMFLTGTSKAGAQPTPVVSPQASVAGKVASHGSTLNSNMHAVNLILRQQMRQIPKDLKAGKITKVQAQTAFQNLKNLRKQELEFFKQNGTKEITVDQKSQMISTLKQNAAGI